MKIDLRINTEGDEWTSYYDSVDKIIIIRRIGSTRQIRMVEVFNDKEVRK